jgi:hypothetical protein
MPDTQIVAVILVIEDVSTSQGSLGQIVGKLLFLQRQLVEAWYLVTQYFYIGKAINVDINFMCAWVLVVYNIDRCLTLTTGCKQECH